MDKFLNLQVVCFCFFVSCCIFWSNGWLEIASILVIHYSFPVSVICFEFFKKILCSRNSSPIFIQTLQISGVHWCQFALKKFWQQACSICFLVGQRTVEPCMHWIQNTNPLPPLKMVTNFDPHSHACLLDPFISCWFWRNKFLFSFLHEFINLVDLPMLTCLFGRQIIQYKIFSSR